MSGCRATAHAGRRHMAVPSTTQQVSNHHQTLPAACPAQGTGLASCFICCIHPMESVLLERASTCCRRNQLHFQQVFCWRKAGPLDSHLRGGSVHTAAADCGEFSDNHSDLGLYARLQHMSRGQTLSQSHHHRCSVTRTLPWPALRLCDATQVLWALGSNS